ncbi:MAG: short-chain dehydrogenase [Caulobacter segnis]|uniref:D-xylose 1-dehydrogenase n=1 Tax=Caulobacter segnis TaxID=88688 RepID=A0A2W5X486_9CAUL|nr:MAG: short-chain dehydrogenase [Caulobacter segnis]
MNSADGVVLPSFSLVGRTALVTGASSGLGARFAAVLAAAGARVVLTARRLEALAAVAAEITARGGQATCAPMDVTDERSVVAAFDRAEADAGPIDTVIANAGIGGGGRSTEMPVAAFSSIMSVNATGAFLTAREAGRRMIANGSRERQDGRILIVASAAAHTPVAGLAAYNASKAAAAMLGRSLAVEWVRQGINVNVLCPGYIRTDINAEMFEGVTGEAQISALGRRRLMTPEDLDGGVLYLCSNASRAVTGSVLTIDDGQSA